MDRAVQVSSGNKGIVPPWLGRPNSTNPGIVPPWLTSPVRGNPGIVPPWLIETPGLASVTPNARVATTFVREPVAVSPTVAR